MPTTEQILTQLQSIAHTWRPLSVLWHLGFALFSVALISGARPSKRTAGLILSLPLFSVSFVAWGSGNPFNGLVFALIGILLAVVALRLPRTEAQIVPGWWKVPGITMVAFGWTYPHFLSLSTPWTYLYAAPSGLIPCPTLSLVIGFALVFGNLGSRNFAVILGIAGLFYGVTGVAQMKVAIDWVLLIGAIVLLVLPFAKAEWQRDQSTSEMTKWGVGPRLAMVSVGYVVLAVIAHLDAPELMLMSHTPHAFFPIAGALLIVAGITLWAMGARVIDRAFTERRLLTSGVYGIVRHPMYSGFIAFVTPGIALWCRSWSLLTVPLAAYVAFAFLSRREEQYLEKTFGEEYLRYKSTVHAVIPFLRPLAKTRGKGN